MTFMIECTRPFPHNEPKFIGPFESEYAAKRWLKLPTFGGEGGVIVDFCDGIHDIIELIKPDRERKFTEIAMHEAIYRAEVNARNAAILEMARSARAFVADENGESGTIPVTYDNLRRNKILTIKLLRERYGIGLKESKDIVDGWQAEREPIVAL